MRGHWKRVIRVMVIVHGQSDLLQIVPACRTSRGGACLLNRREQQRDQNSDDRNRHQQLDQGESTPNCLATDSGCLVLLFFCVSLSASWHVLGTSTVWLIC